jgi:endo-1,4-beta-xylanase
MTTQHEGGSRYMNGPPTPSEGRGRSRLRLFLGACAAALAATAMVAVPGIAHAAVCGVQNGTTNGMYWQMWNNGQGSACITVGSAGNQYSTTWSGIGDQVSGVGWQPGSSQTVNFSGSMSVSGGTGLAALYGWSTSPLVEYYVIENLQGGSPSLGTFMGTVSSDGATYNLYEHQQVNQPSIQGTTTFNQYLAIRQGNTTSGTITTQNFISAWASHGMNLGSLNYQIFATESWGGGSGNSNFTVSHGSAGGGGGGGGGGGSGGCTATLSNGSSGNGWYNLNVAVTGSNTWTVTVNMVAPSVVASTWNVNATWPSQYVMKATPNGSGNNWGFTVTTNGTTTHPSVSCSTG